MAEVQETRLPGVGVRHDFRTHGGDRVGVLVHRGGRRDLLLYDRDDPDSCRTTVGLDVEDAHTLAELLGVSQVSEALTNVQHQVEGLSIDWLSVTEDSPGAGRSLGDLQVRTATGAYVVAVIRRDDTIAAPGPDFVLLPGDTAVAIGRAEGIGKLIALLQR